MGRHILGEGDYMEWNGLSIIWNGMAWRHFENIIISYATPFISESKCCRVKHVKSVLCLGSSKLVYDLFTYHGQVKAKLSLLGCPAQTKYSLLLALIASSDLIAFRVGSVGRERLEFSF